MASVVRDSHIKNGLTSDAIGYARNFHVAHGDHLREQLRTVSTASAFITALTALLPVTGYAAGYRVLRITEDNRFVIDWWAEFEVSAAAEPKVVNQVKNETSSNKRSQSRPA